MLLRIAAEGVQGPHKVADLPGRHHGAGELLQALELGAVLPTDVAICEFDFTALFCTPLCPQTAASAPQEPVVRRVKPPSHASGSCKALRFHAGLER